ncbi:unnamed protein product, partial [Rotaria sordida]
QQDESRSFGQQTQTFTSRTTNGFQQLMNDQSRSTSMKIEICTLP